MRVEHRRLFIGFASIGILDFAGFVAMFANPDLVERIIPALALVQILGFIAIAIIVVKNRREYISGTGTDAESGIAGQVWMPWLFGFIALTIFMRVGLALLLIAGADAHHRSWFGPITGTLSATFFAWLAVRTWRAGSRRKRKESGDKSQRFE